MKFIAVDGEGLTRSDGSHDYVLLASSTEHYIENWQDGLSSRECFDFLLALHAAYPEGVFIAFSFGYDSNKMFKDLHRIHVERLHEHNRVSWVCAVGMKYVIDYIPNKWLQIVKMVDVGGRWTRTGYVKVWDVFGFYQSSFLRAITDWKVATEAQIKHIEEMKLKRGDFTEEERAQIKAYCFEECHLLTALGDQLDDALIESDLAIKQYHGAGAIANVMMKKHQVKSHIIRRPANEDLWQAILRGYFGGRVETFIAGYVNQPVYSYDINSAYPSAIRQLPSLQSGHWRRTQGFESGEKFGLWHCKWDYTGKRGKPLIPFPYRRDKSIYYTLRGEGWYHSPEVQAAYDMGLEFTCSEGMVFTPAEPDALPFQWVEETYHLRQMLKQAGDKREKALKLGLNSLYGKFAQGVSANDRPGQYQCYWYAGWITSYCRGEILRAVAQAPDQLINIATDGIMSFAPLQVQGGKELGEWEIKDPILEGMMIIQPGFILSEFQEILRTRGVDKDSVSFKLFKDCWDQFGIAGKVKAIDTRFITMGRALGMTHNNDDLRELWGRWLEWEIELSFFPNRKLPRMSDSAWATRGYVDLFPTAFEEQRISDPYIPRSLAALDSETEPVEFDRLEIVG